MPIQRITPAEMVPPAANYHHLAVVPPGTTLLFLSGQLGIDRDGHIPDDAGVQAEMIFRQIARGLAAVGMGVGDLIRLNAYVSDRIYLQPYMAARDRFVAQPPPASTLLVVGGFARPEFKVEVEAVAGRAV